MSIETRINSHEFCKVLAQRIAGRYMVSFCGLERPEEYFYIVTDRMSGKAAGWTSADADGIEPGDDADNWDSAIEDAMTELDAEGIESRAQFWDLMQNDIADIRNGLAEVI